jgi:hypothetical protein
MNVVFLNILWENLCLNLVIRGKETYNQGKERVIIKLSTEAGI